MDLGMVNPAVRVALNGLVQRQEAIASNVANVSTPNYTATHVSFEQQLQSALQNPGTGTASVDDFVARSATNDPRRQDGNNVSLERETMLSSETNLQFQLAIRAAEGRFNAYRDVLKAT